MPDSWPYGVFVRVSVDDTWDHGQAVRRMIDARDRLGFSLEASYAGLTISVVPWDTTMSLLTQIAEQRKPLA